MWIERVKTLFKILIKTVLLLAVLYVFFKYVGDFSLGQSIALTAICFIGYELFLYLKARQVQNVFSPFSVTIFPKWYPVLLDYKLIHSAEEYDKLYAACGAKNGNIIHRGYWFTVVHPPNDNGLMPGLIFWNNRNIFLSELDFCESIMGIESDMPMGHKERHPFLDHPAYAGTPEFYVKWGGGGYEFGLEVKYEWWESVKNSAPNLAKIKDDRDYLCGTTRVPIAALPYSVFQEYYGSVDLGRMKKFFEIQDKQLEEKGWKRREDRDSEIQDPWTHLDHKYFEVSHREI